MGLKSALEEIKIMEDMVKTLCEHGLLNSVNASQLSYRLRKLREEIE
jgi:hypothetical protein